MPLPKPRTNESRETFMSRCMSDTETMNDFPKQEQRLAVCFSQWKSHKKTTDTEMAAMILSAKLIHEKLIENTDLDNHGQGD